MILNDIVDEIFVINMNTAPERMKDVQKEFTKIGLTSYTRFPACVFNEGRTRRDRVRGCIYSHHNIIQLAKEKNLKRIMVFEDDVEFKDDFNNYLPIIKEFLDMNDWHMFYLGTNAEQQEKINDNIRRITAALTTHAYIMNSLIFDFYLSEVRPKLNTLEADTFLKQRIHPIGKTFGIIPNIAFQKAGFSYIAGKNRDYTFMKQWW